MSQNLCKGSLTYYEFILQINKNCRTKSPFIRSLWVFGTRLNLVTMKENFKETRTLEMLGNLRNPTDSLILPFLSPIKLRHDKTIKRKFISQFSQFISSYLQTPTIKSTNSM